jgi:hypothetical protein
MVNYPYHPRFGEEIQIVGIRRHRRERCHVIALYDGRCELIPEWMTNPHRAEISIVLFGRIARKSMIHSKERMSMISKIKAGHVSRQAYVYVRQSTSGQVIHHRESQRLQYRLVDRAKELGWGEENIIVIDSDLGMTATGCVIREGFRKLLSAVCEGKAGAIITALINAA